MPVAYPLSLRTVISTAKSRTQPASFGIAQPRRGYGYVEPIGTDTPLFWDVTFRFTREEAVQFRLWFLYALQRGELPFTMPVDTEFGRQTYTLQFLPDQLMTTRQTGEVFEYTAQVMARAELVPGALIATYAGTVGTIPDQTGMAGNAFSLSLAPYWSGGTGPFTYRVAGGALPPLLTLSGSSGVVSGVLSTPGVFEGVVFERVAAFGVPRASNAVKFTVGNPSAAAAGRVLQASAQLVPGNVSGSTSVIASGKTYTPSASLITGSASSSGAGDPLFSDVILLLPFDLESGYAYEQLQPMKDYSPFNHSPGTTGYMKPVNGDGAFGGSRLTSFNNAGSPLGNQIWPKNPATEGSRFARSTANGISMEAMVYGPPFNFQLELSDGNGGMFLIGSGSGLGLTDGDAQAVVVPSGAYGATGWHHIAATCTSDGITQELFYDGSSFGTITASFSAVSDSSNFVLFTGTGIDSVRVTKHRRYTGSFAPPSADFPRS